MTRRPSRTGIGRVRPCGIAGAVAGFAAAAVLLGGCGNTDSGAGTKGFVSGDSTVTLVSAADRAKAPDIRGTTLAGKPFNLAAYRGDVVVLNFWASWCSPCRAETPALQVVAQSVAGKGVAFVGVDTRETDTAAATAFLDNIKGEGVPFTNIGDPDGTVALAFSGTLPPNSIPSTLVIDRRGRIALRIVGPTTRPRLQALLAPLIAESA
jgi:thiol-disulfide isomerase/thioredoxin